MGLKCLNINMKCSVESKHKETTKTLSVTSFLQYLTYKSEGYLAVKNNSMLIYQCYATGTYNI